MAVATKTKPTGIDPALRVRLAKAREMLDAGKAELAEAEKPIEQRRREEERLANARKRLEIGGGLITTHAEAEQALNAAIRALPAVRRAFDTLTRLQSLLSDQERAIQPMDPRRAETQAHIQEQREKIKAGQVRLSKAVRAKFADDDFDIESEATEVLAEFGVSEFVGA